jgi:hypothetical protein
MACGKSWYRNYCGNGGGKFDSRCPGYQRGYSIFADDLAAGIWGLREISSKNKTKNVETFHGTFLQELQITHI